MANILDVIYLGDYGKAGGVWWTGLWPQVVSGGETGGLSSISVAQRGEAKKHPRRS